MRDDLCHSDLPPVDAERAGRIRTDPHLPHGGILIALNRIGNRPFMQSGTHRHLGAPVSPVPCQLLQPPERRRVCAERRDFNRDLIAIDAPDPPIQRSHI